MTCRLVKQVQVRRFSNFKIQVQVQVTCIFRLVLVLVQSDALVTTQQAQAAQTKPAASTSPVKKIPKRGGRRKPAGQTIVKIIEGPKEPEIQKSAEKVETPKIEPPTKPVKLQPIHKKAKDANESKIEVSSWTPIIIDDDKENDDMNDSNTGPTKPAVSPKVVKPNPNFKLKTPDKPSSNIANGWNTAFKIKQVANSNKLEEIKKLDPKGENLGSGGYE